MKKIVVIACFGFITGVGTWFLFLKDSTNGIETLAVRAGDFTRSVSVAGTVVAADRVDLGFSQSGRISRTYADVGDAVVVGTILAEIENGELRASILQKEAALEAERAKLFSIREGSRPEEIAVLEAQVLSDETAHAQTRESVVNTIRDAYVKSDDAVRNKVDKFITNPRTENAKIVFLTSNTQTAITLESKRVSIEKVLLDWQTENANLSAENATQAAVRAQRYLQQVVDLLEEANTALHSAVTSQNVSATSIADWTSDVATARTTISTSATALTSAVTTEKAAAATLEKDKRNLALTKAGATEADINTQAAQVRSAEADVIYARAQLAKTIIQAPFSGIVTHMDVDAGEIVSPGTSQISMIGRGAFQIESFIPEIHVSLLKIGNPAVVTLDAYGDDAPFPAAIVSIDPAETIQDGISTYRATLQFTDQDPRIKAGMTANIVITTEHKSGIISIPQGVLFSRDGKKYVHVQEQKSIAEREVITGSISSRGDVEIISGLKEGDVVVLGSTTE